MEGERIPAKTSILFFKNKKKSPNRQNFLKTASYFIISQKLAWKHRLLSPAPVPAPGSALSQPTPVSLGTGNASPSRHGAHGVTAACHHVPAGSQQRVPTSPRGRAELNPCSHSQGLPGRGQEGLGSPRGSHLQKWGSAPGLARGQGVFWGMTQQKGCRASRMQAPPALGPPRRPYPPTAGCPLPCC